MWTPILLKILRAIDINSKSINVFYNHPELQDELNDLIDIYEHMENMNLCLLSLAKKILKYELDFEFHVESCQYYYIP